VVTMLAMMTPMVAMYLIAEVPCRRNDRRKALRKAETE